MHAITSESLNTDEVCAWPREVPSYEHEADLVAQLQTGNERAFRRIVDRYAPKIYRACYGILRSREDADEIAQEVFAKVYFSIRGFGGRSSLYAWIYRIAVNECYGFLRKKRIRLVCPGDYTSGYVGNGSDNGPVYRLGESRTGDK